MDRQAIFNKVWHALTKQGKRAADRRACMYITPDGRKCAVGHLLPDGHAGFGYEGPVYGLLGMYSDLADLWGFDRWSDRDFLRALQAAHDNSAGDFVPEFQAAMRAIAREHSLTVPE